MTDTVYVRFPDEERDDPSKPGEPNVTKEIPSFALDEYRSRGYVQCEADGSKAAKVQKLGAGAAGSDVTLAKAGDDPEAAKIREPNAPEAVAPATGGKA